MAGHGSPPAEDKANHPGRQVGRLAAAAVDSMRQRTLGPVQGPYTEKHALATELSPDTRSFLANQPKVDIPVTENNRQQGR